MASDKDQARDEAIASFKGLVQSEHIEVIALSQVEPEAIKRGVERLAEAHKWAAPVEVSTDPVVFVRTPRWLSGQRISPATVRAAPFGWDSTFGGAFTLSVLCKEAGWLGRAYVVGTSPDLSAHRAGRWVVVLVSGNVPTVAMRITLRDDEALSLLEENVDRAEQHRATVRDVDALFWDVARLSRPVIEGIGATASDRLALGWIKAYGDAVAELERHHRALQAAPRPAWPQQSDIAGPYQRLVDVLRAPALPSPDQLLSWARNEYERDTAEFLKLLHQEWHDFVHEVIGEHTPYCSLARAAGTALLFSSEITSCGQVVPVWRAGALGSHALRANAFPERSEPEAFWSRLVHVPVEWGAMIDGADFPIDVGKDSPHWVQMPLAEDVDVIPAAAAALLREAKADRRWTIPPGALVQVPFGPFTHVQLAEHGETVEFALRTEAGEFSCGAIGIDAEHMWWEALADADADEDSSRLQRVAAALYLVLAALVRDFLVVEERESAFEHRDLPKSSRIGHQGASDRIVYLPRVRYLPHPNVSRCTTELDLETTPRRRHEVQGHLRKCQSPAGSQLFLAARYGLNVPAGYTFVRPHERGGKAARRVLYRSRSALACLFEARPTEPMSKPRGPRSSAPWFQFERDVYRLMDKMGFDVEHVAASARGDKGVDVFATKGHGFESVAWVIQCKCYAPRHRVGPQVVRELLGTLADYPRGTSGAVVTTSSFTHDAKDIAAKHAIRLIEGDEFAALLA